MVAAIFMAVVCGLFISVNAGFFAMSIMTLAITGGVAIAASLAFDRMESLEG